MAELSLSISQLYAAAFGANRAFEPKFNRVAGIDGNSNGFLRRERGATGAPYYGKYDGGDYYLPVTLGGVALPHPVVSYRGAKKFVDTELTERPGPVSEYINMGGWEITVRGIAVGKYNELPEELLAELAGLYTRAEPVEMVNVLTDMILLPFNRMVTVRDYSLIEVKGVRHVRAYEMAIRTDSVFDLKTIS